MGMPPVQHCLGLPYTGGPGQTASRLSHQHNPYITQYVAKQNKAFHKLFTTDILIKFPFYSVETSAAQKRRRGRRVINIRCQAKLPMHMSDH